MKCRNTRIHGIFLPTAFRNARNTAESCIALERPMDTTLPDGNLSALVLALPLGALFVSLFRYPSPKGRQCDIARAPSFFWCGRVNDRDRRRTAENRYIQGECFDSWSKGAPFAPQTGQYKKGGFSCDVSLSQSHLFWHWLLAAIHPLNRAFSELVQGWARRQSLTVTCLPVLRSAQRAICSIARQILDAVEPTARKPQSIAWSSKSHWLGRYPGVQKEQWGASTKRGADNGQNNNSGDCDGSVRGVQCARGFGPDGFRPLSADPREGITASSGFMPDLMHIINEQKRRFRRSVEPALCCFQMK